MRNFPFLFLLGLVTLTGAWLGLSLELVLSVVGAAMGAVALIHAEATDQMLRHIEGELRVLPELRKAVGGRLRGLVLRTRRSPSWAPPKAG
jgi:hypothetical protein